MRETFLTTLLLVTIVGLAWISVIETASCTTVANSSGNYESSYKVTVQSGYYRSERTLYVSVPRSVGEYYGSKSHTVYGEGGYPRFVAPDSVQSIADNLRNVTGDTPYDDEGFANAVLMIAREIPYVRSDAKYPVETILDNQADCDGLSILAASIMKAGGLDVVLLLYKNLSPTHMNIGVYLEQMPVSHSWWVSPVGVEYGNKTYWVAECTSLAEWTVGDRPELLARDKPLVISLANCEKESPAHVSSSLDGPMQDSSVSIDLSTGYRDVNGNERTINVSGSISPSFPNETVTFYVNQPGYSPTPSVAATDEFGNYTFLWNVSLPGTYIVRTSWAGCFNYSGSDSDVVTVFVGAQQPFVQQLANFLSNSGSTDVPSQFYSPGFLSFFNQGAKEFLKSNTSGTEVVLSGDFMVLSDGHELTLNETTITIPAHQTTVRMPRSRQTVRVQIPEKTVQIPGVELLNSQFGFILKRNDEDNFTASVKLLTNEDVSQISRGNALLVNASDVASKNAWHKAVTSVSDGTISIEVYDENGTRLESKTTNVASTGSDELAVVMTYPVGQVLAFKNLKVEAVNKDPTPITSTPAPNQGNGVDFLFPYIRFSLLFAGVILAVLCLRERVVNKRSDVVPKQSQR